MESRQKYEYRFERLHATDLTWSGYQVDLRAGDALKVWHEAEERGVT